MCAFNYRFVPAVRLAREMIEAGELGDIYHFRGRYLQEWGNIDPSSTRLAVRRLRAGSGALGDLGAHVIDLARYLVGETVSTVSALTATFQPGSAPSTMRSKPPSTSRAARSGRSRPPGSRRGARTRSASRSTAPGARSRSTSNGSTSSRSARGTNGFTTRLVTEAHDPFWQWWWPHGHIIGWEHTFVHEIHHLLQAIATDGDVRPYGADFEDGYRAAEVCDAILRSSESGRREAVTYR